MKPKFYKSRPIINPGETYEIDDRPYKVITAVAGMQGVSGDAISLSRLTYILEDVETDERVRIGERELLDKFKD